MKKLILAIGLTALAFSTPAFAQTDEEAIARLNELGLEFRNAPFDAEALAEIQTMRIPREALEALTDTDLRHLTRMPRLGHLELAAGDALTPDGLAVLAGVENLWSLSFRGGNLTDAHIAALSDIEGLRRLDLALNRNIGDDALAHIAAHETLRSLTLDSTAVTDDGIAALAGHPALEQLSLTQTDITDAAFEPLGTIATLKRQRVQPSDWSVQSRRDFGARHTDGR